MEINAFLHDYEAGIRAICKSITKRTIRCVGTAHDMIRSLCGMRTDNTAAFSASSILCSKLKSKQHGLFQEIMPKHAVTFTDGKLDMILRFFL